MTSLSPELHRDIRQTLLDCGSFNDSSYLRDLFTDGRISPWRYSLPSRDNVIALVEAYIAFLVGKTRADTHKNALVLFLQVLSERHDPAVTCHQNLLNTAADLEAELRGEKRPSLQKSSSTPQQTTPQTTTPTTQPRRTGRQSDSRSYYERGLNKLIAALSAADPEAHREALGYQDRLLRNLAAMKRYGETDIRRAEHNEVIDNLNDLALDMVGTSFNELCNQTD
jgi:hypothetical protein